MEKTLNNLVNLVNLTPHTLTLVQGNERMEIVSSGVARCSAKQEQVGVINGIPLMTTTYGEVTGLPDPQEGTVFIVSALVLSQCPDRTDLVGPTDYVRDEGGQVVGCRALTR